MFGNMLMGAAGASLAAGGYSVSNSIVLDDGSSQYLTGSTLSGGSERIGTYSFWTKRANLGTQQEIYTQYRTSSSNMAFRIRFLSGDTLDIVCENDAGGVILRRTTTQVFRDPHAFLHVHIQINGNKTDDTCCTLTINGSAVSDFSTKTNLSSGTDLNLFTSSKSASIGSTPAPAGYYDGYFSEFVAIDSGNAAATSFGEYSPSGVWRPIDVTTTITSAATGVIPTSSNWDIGSTLSAGTGTLDFTSGGGTSAASTNLLTGDFTVTFTATALNDALFGVFAANERGTFNKSQDDGFMDSMTNSFWYDEGAAGGTFYFGSTSEATGVAIAAGSVVTITRSGSTISITDDASTVHTFTGTYNGTMYFLGGCRNTGSQSLNFDSISFDKVNQFGNNGFYLPFTDSTFLGVDGNGTETAVVSYQSSQWTGNTGSYSYSDGRIDATTADDAIKSVDTFTGDFELEFYITDKGNVVVGMYEISEDGTFNQNLSTGGLNSMTNSWWIKTSSVAANNDVMYGSTEVAGTVGWADGDTVKITRSSGTFTVYRNGSSLHEWSQTSSNEVRIVVAQGDVNVTLDQFCWVDAGTLGNNFFTSGSPTQSSDTPTNNSATLTTIDGSGATFSNGNLVVSSNTTNSYKGGTGCIGLAPGSGSWYVEALCTGATGANKEYVFGAATNDTNKSPAGYFPGSPTYSNDDEHGYYSGSGGIVYNGSSSTGSVGIYGDGNTVALRFDMDVTTPTCKFYVNDTLKHTANLTVGKTYYPHFNTQDLNLTFTVNFGATSFTYTLPTGHLAINTTNLYTNAAPAIEDGTAHFQATIYTGDGTNNRGITQTGNSQFQPDLVWLKARSAARFNQLTDAVRGVGNVLQSNSANAEGTDGPVTAFNTNGFDVNYTNTWDYNFNGTTEVAWQWKGDGTSGASNTNGSITSTVNVNDTAGFSIVEWSGTGANGTVGHGLSAAPDLIIVKATNAANNWRVYHSSNTSAPETDYLVLDLSVATADNNTIWNDTAPTSTVFSVGSDGGSNASGTNNMIAFCFRGISGYSSFGSFKGNGGPDGPLIQLDFKPAYIMFKNTNATGSWAIFDIFRSLFNPVDDTLIANGADVEVSGSDDFDFLANGVKVRSTWAAVNGSGNTIIYAAFAENPFAGSSPATAR